MPLSCIKTHHDISLFQKTATQSAKHYKLKAQNLISIFLYVTKFSKMLIRDKAHIPRLVPQVWCKLREERIKVTDVWVA